MNDPEAYARHNKPETGARPGVYKHEKTSEELWAETFPAADAFVRQGWVYDRELPSAEERAKLQYGLGTVIKEKEAKATESESKEEVKK